MKNILIITLLLAPFALAEDYKSALRLQEGDVISADVFNDILDRIELSLTTVQSSDLIGTWDIVQTTTATGVLGNGGSGTFAGGFTPIDSIYRQRNDTAAFSDDGDGTFSLQTTNYCPFIQGDSDANNPCSLNFALVDGRFLLKFSGANYAYVAEKRSETRIILSVWATGSQSYNIIRLDKKNIPPASPTSLSASNLDGLITLSWAEGDTNATSYKIMSKDSIDEQYTELTSGIGSTTYSDTVNSGNSRWYRIFAVNANGESIGSNVVRVTVE